MPIAPFVSHVEWVVTDWVATAAFFEALLGWRFTALGPHYGFYEAPQGPAIGLLQRPGVVAAEVSPMLIHIQVSDLRGTLDRALALGATLHTPPTAVPDHGEYTHIYSPTQALIGLFTPATPQ